MKKLNYFLFLAAIMLVSRAGSQSLTYIEPVRTMDVPARTVDIVFDGVADESSWSDPETVSIFYETGWDGTDEDFSGYFQVCWDMQYLYLFFDITDNINHSFDEDYYNAWMFDCAEIHFNLEIDNDLEEWYDANTIQIRINRGIDSVLWTGRARAEDFYYHWHNKASGDGWIVETAIPWTCAMPAGSLPDDFNDYVANQMGFEVMFSDSDNADGDPQVGNRDAQAAWDHDLPDTPDDATEDMAWMNVTVFGIIDLLGSPAPPPPPPPPPPEPEETFYKPVNAMVVPPKKDTPVIDGLDNESSYSETEYLDIYNYEHYDGLNDLAGNFRTYWDSTYLYVFASVIDDDSLIWHGGDDPRMYDNVGIFIDMDTTWQTAGYQSDVASFLFNRGSDTITSTNNFGNAAFGYQSLATAANAWQFEVAIPWVAVMPPLAAPVDFLLYKDGVLGFDLMINDFDGENPDPALPDAQAAWDMDSGKEHYASDSTWAFGVMTLSEDTGAFNSSPFVTPVRTMDIPATTEFMLIDGFDREDCWSEKQEVVLFERTGWEDESDLSGYFRTSWDLEYLYFYANISDDYDHSYVLSGNSWEFDCIEFYIDLDTIHEYSSYDVNTIQLRFNRGLDSLLFTGRAESSDPVMYHTHNKPGGDGWIVEAAIPWVCALPAGSMPEDIHSYVNNAMGFDITFSDSDNSDGDPTMGNRDAMAAWDSDDPDTPGDLTEDLAWQNTHVLGIIHLLGSPVDPEPNPPLRSEVSIEPVRETYIDYVPSNSIVIDGEVEDEGYGEEIGMVAFETDGWYDDSDLGGYFQVAQNEDTLYFFARVTDDTAHIAPEDHLNPQYFDNVELFIADEWGTLQALKNDYEEYATRLLFLRGHQTVHSSLTINPDNFNVIIREADDDSGWIIEAAIPWTEVGKEADPDKTVVDLPIGFDVIFNDSDSDDPDEGARDAALVFDQDYYDVAEEVHAERMAEYDLKALGIANVIILDIEDRLPTNISVFPNPASEQIHFSQLEHISTIELTDMQGRFLDRIADPGAEFSLDVSGYSEGIYLCRVSDKQGRSKTLKIIIQ